MYDTRYDTIYNKQNWIKEKKKVHYMCANIFLMFRVDWNKEKWPAGWPESEWTRLNFNNFYMK